MTVSDHEKYLQATAIFKLGVKSLNKAVHRTINKAPKGKGWVQCLNSPTGVMCRPDKIKEAIIHFTKAYEIFPDIVALNQMALGYEMIGEIETARECFNRMRLQAQEENNASYIQAAELGLQRLL